MQQLDPPTSDYGARQFRLAAELAHLLGAYPTTLRRPRISRNEWVWMRDCPCGQGCLVDSVLPAGLWVEFLDRFFVVRVIAGCPKGQRYADRIFAKLRRAVARFEGNEDPAETELKRRCREIAMHGLTDRSAA